MRLKKPFAFNFPVTTKKVVDLQLKNITVAELTVTGTAYLDTNVSRLDMDTNRYDADIDYVMHLGHDIKEVLEITDLWADIEESAVVNARKLFSEKEVAI